MGKTLNCMLLVDDDDGHHYLAQAVISRTAVARNVRTVWNGREAIDYVTSRGKFEGNCETYPKPDLILLDLNMPVMDGWQFLNEYRQLDEAHKRRTMIVILTTSDNPDEVQRAKGIREVAEFISKPLTPSLLNEMVQRYFRENI